MEKKFKSKNRFTHFSNSKARTIQERMEELLSEGIAVRGRERSVLADENLHLDEMDFRCYKDGIDVQAEMSPDNENSENNLLEARKIERYFLIPCNCDEPDIIEYYLRYTG